MKPIRELANGALPAVDYSEGSDRMRAESKTLPHRGVSFSNRAFTLVELLVVISIIGVLMGLLLPAIQRAKENSRRVSCTNNQRNLALAHLQYYGANRFFVGYVAGVGTEFKAASWVVSLFPYIDRNDLLIQWSRRNVITFNGDDMTMTDSHPEAYIELLVCPSDPPPNSLLSYWSYAVNGGWADATNINEQQCNGVFFNHFRRYKVDTTQGVLFNPFDPRTTTIMTVEYLNSHDGASNTLMLTENIQQDATIDYTGSGTRSCTDPPIGTWRNIYPFPFTNLTFSPLTTHPTFPNAFARDKRCVFWHSADNPVWRINGDPTANMLDIAHARPSSHHPGGVVAAFCDGHTRFINQSIDYATFKQMMTSYGDEAHTLGIEPDNVPFNDGDL